MSFDHDPFREEGVLGAPHFDSDRPGVLAIAVEFGGSVQHFCSPWIPPGTAHRESFIRELCATFGVGDLDALKGQPAAALRCFDFWNEPIEGLESLTTGKRFTILGWARRFGVADDADRLEQRNEQLEKEIRRHERQRAEAVETRRTLLEHYRDWEAAP